MVGGYGIDFVDIVLDPAADGQPLTIELFHPPVAGAEFNVQILHLADSVAGDKPKHVMTQVADLEAPADGNAEGRLVYTIPALDGAAYNRLGLVITRLDAQEASEPAGEYTIVLRSSDSPRHTYP
jgi:hypothetical protein